MLFALHYSSSIHWFFFSFLFSIIRQNNVMLSRFCELISFQAVTRSCKVSGLSKSLFILYCWLVKSALMKLWCFWKTRCRPLLNIESDTLSFAVILLNTAQLIPPPLSAFVFLQHSPSAFNNNVLCVTLTLWRFEIIKSNLHSTTEGWVQFLRLYLKTFVYLRNIKSHMQEFVLKGIVHSKMNIRMLFFSISCVMNAVCEFVITY